MEGKLNQWINNVQSLLFPGVCVLCGGPGVAGRDLCAACRETLPRVALACVRCARPLRGGPQLALCGGCLHKPPAYARALALFAYAYPVDHLLQRLKFDARLELARILGELMAAELATRLESRPDVLMPVPLHAARLRERGFNQALELARPLSRRLKIALDPNSCRRLQHTTPQSGLSRKARRKNVKGAFSVVGKVRGHVVIVDDVMTTGSTVQELARCLLRAGADRVDVWVCARA